MEPTLHIGDRILVLKLAYRVTSPAIGDVVVFHAPYQERYDCGNPHVEDLVKRVMATPGDVIVSHGNRIYVNGKLLDQSWQHVVKLVTPIPRTKVGVNRYYMMGDNHPASCDSRVWGTLPRSNIIGKAVLIYWPLSRLSII